MPCNKVINLNSVFKRAPVKSKGTDGLVLRFQTSYYLSANNKVCVVDEKTGHTNRGFCHTPDYSLKTKLAKSLTRFCPKVGWGSYHTSAPLCFSEFLLIDFV